jgi:hypothetical protein
MADSTPLSEHLFAVRKLDLAHGHLLLSGPDFDFDSFPDIAEQLLVCIDARVIEKELNADLHVWIIDFEGSRLLLKGEHYASALWIEVLSSADNDALAFIATLLPHQSGQLC